MRTIRQRGTAALIAASAIALLVSAAASSTALQPRISINDPTVVEGNSGTVNCVFTVTAQFGDVAPITGNYATANGTATAPGDYTASSGTFQIPPRETTAQITVPVVGDTLNEPNETFRVTLSNVQNAIVEDGEGICTIQDDGDLPPAPPPPPPAPAMCVCKKKEIRLAGFNAHGSTTLKGLVTGKAFPAEFWDFVVKGAITCTKGRKPDCEGFLKLESPSTFPPFATWTGSNRNKKTIKCKGKKCDASTPFAHDVRIRIEREQILEARKTKKAIKKKLKIRAGCRGRKGKLYTFTLVFTGGSSFAKKLSDQDGDGKADG
ncbi:MAG TPA: Calx-beta domain-containing protein [Gaiellaceae bacterium]|nr:Calx-beta domain-containing protein [Gaiellaceae bacterium]